MKVAFAHTCKKFWESGYVYLLPVLRISWKAKTRIPKKLKTPMGPLYQQERSVDLLWLTFKVSFVWYAKLYL